MVSLRLDSVTKWPPPEISMKRSLPGLDPTTPVQHINFPYGFPFQGLGSAISGNLGGIVGTKNSCNATRQPMVALRLDTVTTPMVPFGK